MKTESTTCKSSLLYSGPPICLQPVDVGVTPSIFLFGVTRVTQSVLPLMRKQKSGIVVNISSGTVTMGGHPGGSAYVSTKYALEDLSNCMAYELELFGIKVVLVEPGVIRTNFVNDVVTVNNINFILPLLG